MFRTIILALAATATLTAAAMAPTSASAWGGGWKHHHHYHGGWYGTGFGYVGGSDCYYVKRIVDTPYGLRTKRFLVCN